MSNANSPGTTSATPSGTLNSTTSSILSNVLMLESTFHQHVDAILAAIELAMDHAPIDAELNGGILTLTFENNTKVIVNRQTPLREIWVAAKSGGFHFKFDETTEQHQWKDTRSAEPLAVLLSRVVSEQSQNVIHITFE